MNFLIRYRRNPTELIKTAAIQQIAPQTVTGHATILNIIPIPGQMSLNKRAPTKVRANTRKAQKLPIATIRYTLSCSISCSNASFA